MITVQDIYDYLDGIAPFSSQEKWDNSGILVGDPEDEVASVLVTLDIDSEACSVAEREGCELIISHHPVIFQSIRRLRWADPVYQLAFLSRSAICSHTPMDIAEGGINDILAQKLGEKLPLAPETLPLDAAGCGRIVTLETPMTAAEIAGIAKEVLGCPYVRLMDAGRKITRLGICSGSGASMLEEIEGRCDALLTGDVKHDRWYAAKQYGISLIDCGHYHTEIVMVHALAERLRDRFPALTVIEWEGGDPVSYV